MWNELIVKILGHPLAFPKRKFREHIKQCLDFLNWYIDHKTGVDLNLKYRGVVFCYPLKNPLLGFISKIYGKEIWFIGYKPVKYKDKLRVGFIEIYHEPNYIFNYVHYNIDISHAHLEPPCFWNLQFLPCMSHELLQYALLDIDPYLPDKYFQVFEYYTKDLRKVTYEDDWYWVVQGGNYVS